MNDTKGVVTSLIPRGHTVRVVAARPSHVVDAWSSGWDLVGHPAEWMDEDRRRLRRPTGRHLAQMAQRGLQALVTVVLETAVATRPCAVIELDRP